MSEFIGSYNTCHGPVYHSAEGLTRRFLNMETSTYLELENFLYTPYSKSVFNNPFWNDLFFLKGEGIEFCNCFAINNL